MTFSSSDNMKPQEELNSSYKEPRLQFGVNEFFLDRAAISVDMRVYLSVSHRITGWFTLPDPEILSMPGKHIPLSTRNTGSRFGVVFTNCSNGKAFRSSLLIETSAALLKRDKASSREKELTLLSNKDKWIPAFIELIVGIAGGG